MTATAALGADARLTHNPDLIGAYFRSIRASQPLSREREGELARRIRQGDIAARNELVEANTKYVIAVAWTYAGRGISLEDLISEGNDGLLYAAERFDERCGCKFITYAVWRIRQRILLALPQAHRTVRMPQSCTNDRRRADRESTRLAQRIGRTPTDDEVQDALGLTDSRWAAARNSRATDTLLDGPVNGDLDADFPVLETLADDAPDPLEALEHEERRAQVAHLLERLDPRRRRILVMRFGLGDDPPMNLEEISATMGLTRERVRQLQVMALEDLRRAARGFGLAPEAGTKTGRGATRPDSPPGCVRPLRAVVDPCPRGGPGRASCGAGGRRVSVSIVGPRELVLRLAQQWTPHRPVTCRCCCGLWPSHARGCPVPSALQALWELEGQATRSVVVHTEQQEEHHG